MRRDEELDDDDTRLDKWLWAARFFKTRNLARTAINGGKVHVNGDRAKPSKTVQVGMTISVSLGQVERVVIVKAISSQRGGAPQAALLYEETEESIKKRTDDAEKRKLFAFSPQPEKRPDKKQRRDLRRIKHGFND